MAEERESQDSPEPEFLTNPEEARRKVSNLATALSLSVDAIPDNEVLEIAQALNSLERKLKAMEPYFARRRMEREKRANQAREG